MKWFGVVCSLLILAGMPASAQLAASHGKAQHEPSLPGGAPFAAGKPVVRVNGAVLTDRDLLREMYRMFPYAKQHNGGFPKSMEADIRAGAMKMIIFDELAYQEALRRNMTIPPARMQKAMKSFRNQFASDDDYREFMRVEVNNSQQLLRTKVKRSLLIEQLLKTQIKDKSVISDLEVKKYYREHPETFRYNDSISFQSISILPKANETAAQKADDRKRAENALRQAKATKSYEEFGVLAQKISEDDYRVMMGDHRVVDASKLPPQVVKAAMAMKPGQVSDLVQVQDAYCVLRLNARVPAGIRPFEQVKESLRKKLTTDKSEQLRTVLGNRLRSKAKIEQL